MSRVSTFGVMGGDERQLYLARSIAGDGYSVVISCLEQGEGADDLPSLPFEKLPEVCGIILLPLPVTRDGKTLNTPLSGETVVLDDRFAGLFSSCSVYAGMTGKLKASSPLWEHARLFDYYSREELTVGNAFLTAEAAVCLAISNTDRALAGARCLVTGFGRIGRALCGKLFGMGARVDCCARKREDLTAIRAMGCFPLEYRQIEKRYDIIFNTVPAVVLGPSALSRQDRNTLILELASLPGGIDLEAARLLGLRVEPAGSLPGRFSPRTSGELIKETVYNMMEEV